MLKSNPGWPALDLCAPPRNDNRHCDYIDSSNDESSGDSNSPVVCCVAWCHLLLATKSTKKSNKKEETIPFKLWAERGRFLLVHYNYRRNINPIFISYVQNPLPSTNFYFTYRCVELIQFFVRSTIGLLLG